MILFKFQMVKVDYYGDVIFQEIQCFYSYDKGYVGWVLLVKGFIIVVIGYGFIVFIIFIE